MNDYKTGETWEVEFMSTYSSGLRRYYKLSGEIVFIRPKYVIFEDFEGNGYYVHKKDFKPIKKVKKPQQQTAENV